ncbi:MAG: VWA domain-containing protein [Acidobacteriota bacterium]|nr:VWA domain-containing protein [Acidobacteriota bacterium]NLT33622.1 VWA domain-containing protein [Acidobacteriota bacterium]
MTHLRIGTAVLIALCAGLLPGPAAQPRAPEDPPPKAGRTIRAAVDMVSLPVVVTSRDGGYTTGLTKEDFQVFEDNVPQEIAAFSAVEDPVSVALVIDTSGSTESQLARIQAEAMRFVRLLREEDAAAVVSFADEVTLIEPFSITRRKNPEAIRKIRPGGLSAVYEAVWLTMEQVLKLEYGRKAMVILSDGIDNRSESVSREETLEVARATDTPIYSVYFPARKKRAPRWGRLPIPGDAPERADGRKYLEALARSSGGLLVDASREADLGSAFARIARELRSRYSLGYYPRNLKRDGSFRTLKVTVGRPGLTARTRGGYVDR